MLLCSADITSKNEYKVHKYKNNLKLVYQKLKEVEARDKIRNWQPPIDGDVIMNKLELKPSKIIGIIKTQIREAILEGKIKNNYNEAEKFMYKIAKDLSIKH